MRKALQRCRQTGRSRLLSLLLCFALLAALLPPQTLTAFASADLERVTVTCEGEPAQALQLAQNEKSRLQATCTPALPQTTYQWQILAEIDSDLWVNIYDGTDRTLSLSYALLSSLLDESGSAYVRCVCTAGGNSVFSAPVCVTVSFSAPTAPAGEEVVRGARYAAAPRAPVRTPRSDPEYVDISINYLDAISGQPIYTGFTAQIQYGTAYTNTVISPTYLGYAPYYNHDNPAVTVPETGPVDAYDDATVILLNLPASYNRPSYTVNIYYKAIDVPYAVRYYFQNINDDLYTEDVGLYRISAAKTGTIISNTDLEVPDPDKTRGFTKLYHYPESVAADGSTVFQCYYDRNYYMLKFDMDGGYGTEPLYARYNTPFVVNQPTRHGYVFIGWDDITNGTGDGVADALPGTIPDENRTYKALWQTVNTTYSTVYWLQNADDDEYSYIGSVKNNAQSGTTVSGLNNLTATTVLCGSNHTHTTACYPEGFAHYVYSHADADVLVHGDGSTVVNVYYNRKQYTLRFYYAREKNGAYQIVGGTTYDFGNINKPRPSPYTIEKLLAAVPNSQWGGIRALPTIKAAYADKYVTGTLTASNGYTYHYLDVVGRYNANLADLWPGEAFEPIQVSETHTQNGASGNMGSGQWGNYAYLAGWNGEFKVKYTKEFSNSTIKGMFQKLGEYVLYDSVEGSSDIVNFLGFFNNGANISWSVPRQWIYELYLPVLPGEATDLTYNGVNYRLYKSIDTSDNNTTLADQTQPTLHGFVANGKRRIENGQLPDRRFSYTAQFFYARQSFSLTLHNYNDVLSHTYLPYQTGLDEHCNISPPYPSTLEQNAYTFGGWYYSPGCFDGSEYAAGDTMPAKDVGLYAKWTPVSHTLRFFRTYDDMLAFEETGSVAGLIETRTVTHGNVLGSIPNPVDTSGFDYTFAGWFYMKTGNKTAYTPLDMPVTRDMNVFADWGSHSAQPYRIHYALQQSETAPAVLALLSEAAQGTPEDNRTYEVSVAGEAQQYVYLASDGKYHRLIAPDTSGFAYQGNTRTFFPKAGEPLNQLYPAYNDGYFPTLASHSITVEYEENKEDPRHNVFTFTYVHAVDITYRVEYRYLETGLLIDSAPGGGSLQKTSSKAVVTERFAVITDYIPDAFYKRLILSVIEDEHGNYVGSPDNVVTFYYSKNTQNAFYAVHHMLQKLGTDDESLVVDSDGNYINYTESDAHTEGIGEIGSLHRIVPQSFSGFSVKDPGFIKGLGPISLLDAETDPHFNITIQQNGTELYIFYTRNPQNYRIYYLAYGTDISNLSSLSYDPNDPTHANGVLLPVESGVGRFGATVTATARPVGGMNCVSAVSQQLLLRANDTQNYLVFFYAPLQFTVEYRVWSRGGGSLDRTIEVVNGAAPFEGTTATPSAGYAFEGFYLDDACTMPVGDQGIVTGNKLVPQTLNLSPMPVSNVFYAKFTPLHGTLTIRRENTAADECNGKRIFVYKITCADDSDFVLYVSAPANGSVTITNLLSRTYTVEQQNGWSWRYTDTAQTVTVPPTGAGADVIFNDAPTRARWLSGNSGKKTNRKG